MFIIDIHAKEEKPVVVFIIDLHAKEEKLVVDKTLHCIYNLGEVLGGQCPLLPSVYGPASECYHWLLCFVLYAK